MFLIKEALDSLIDPVINGTWEKICLEIVKYLSVTPPEDKESLDQGEHVDEAEHLAQEQSLAEVESKSVDTNSNEVIVISDDEGN